MPEVRTERAARLLPIAVDSALLVGFLLGMLGPSSTPSVADLRPSTALHGATDLVGTNLTVDPPSYWMRTGSTVTFQTVWSSGSARCNVTPLWYRWSVEEGTATGFLNGTSGPSTTFVAESFDSGTVSVLARSDAVLECGIAESIVERTSAANITVIVPLSLSGIELGPNPLLPGEDVTLSGRVAGGEAPYVLEITWGDASRSTAALPASGSFEVGHRFSAGTFVPSVLASDSGGDFVNASVSEVLSVGSGLEVAVVPSTYVAEVGVPVEFVGIVGGPSSGAIVLYDCSNATVTAPLAPSASLSETAFSCTFLFPGTAEVLFGAYASRPGGPSASVVLYEQVVLPPRVSIEPVERFQEAGGTELAQVRVTGGVLPLSLTWNLSGNASGGRATVWSDGVGVVSLPLGVPGGYSVGTRVNDTLGGTDVNVSATLHVDARLAVDSGGTSFPRSSGVSVQLVGEVLSGCPPFSWWVVPELAPTTGSMGNGNLSSIGQFAWNAGYAREGNLSITVGVADACGATWRSGLSVSLVPSLSVEVSAAPGPQTANETLVVNLSIQGGTGPFRVFINASDNESWNQTASSDGTFRWPFPATANGSLELEVSIFDSLGGSVRTNLSVTLVPPTSHHPTPPPPTPPPSILPGPSGNSTTSSVVDPTWLLVPVLLLVGSVGAVLFVRRRRARRERRIFPAPDPVETLRRIIEPADGAERFTVELMAEEAGIPLTLVRSTIDRLVSEGAVHSENGADGEEVLSWSSQSGR